MSKIKYIKIRLREEQQAMMLALYTGECKDKYEWSPRFEEIFSLKDSYTCSDVKKIRSTFKNCNVLMESFNNYLSLGLVV